MVFNLTSENVQVFPIATPRVPGLSETRLLNEHNLSGIIRQLFSGSTPGFIISTEIIDEENNVINVKFNIYGYQFDIKIDPRMLEEPLQGDGYLYAYIVLDSVINEIDGQDTAGKYTGLYLTTSEKEITDRLESLAADQEVIYMPILKLCDGKLEEVSNMSFLGSGIGGIDGKYNK